MLTCETGQESIEEKQLIPNIVSKRIPPRILPTPTTNLQKQGLRYERKVVRALRSRGIHLEHNPWFEYYGRVYCPDILVYELSLSRIIVIEVKLTYTPMALAKLKSIYCPMVKSATVLERYKIFPLVICKNITSNVLNDLFFNDSIHTAITSHHPVYLWPGFGPIS